MKTNTSTVLVKTETGEAWISCTARAAGLITGLALAMVAVLTPVPARTQETNAAIHIWADQPGPYVSPTLWGIFFEEINHAGDGGLYAELIQNRSFEEPNPTNAWVFHSTGTAMGYMEPDRSMPLNPNSPTALKLVRFASGSGYVGIINTGYWGIHIQAGKQYRLRFHARCSPEFTGPVQAQLQDSTGSIIYAQLGVSGLTTNWQRFELTLVPSATATNAQLALRIAQPGTVWFDVVSLFPADTFRGRTNGLRADLALMLSNLAPSFVRFPGGCFVEGNYLSNAFNWKKSIGDIAERPGHLNDVWGYYSSDGLGYHEYLQMCEDLGAEPLFVINCGMAHNETVPLDQMTNWVQAALDAIEYANGPTNTYWGWLRAVNGHPEPFNLKYIQIGNENGGTAYNDRYALFYDAIKAKYPDMKIIACVWGGIPTSRPVEIMDEHYYSSPQFFINNATKYDSYSRTGPKVYVGEFAVTSGCGNGNLAGALGEAAFMTGIERNSDVVIMASYAPLFAHLNNKAWNPDLIYFDNHRAVATPSYHVQQLFSQNRGHVVLPTQVALYVELTNPPPRGAIGLGSWNTAVEYTNVVVTSNGVTLYQSDFGAGASEWRVYNGTWLTTNGLYRQTALITDCRSTTGDTNWANYTITLKARKLYGSEGFLIIFNWRDDNNWTWWNIGGWNNTQHGLENCVKGGKSDLGSRVSGSIESNRWYDIRIELDGLRVKCYLDGALVHDVRYPEPRPKGAIGLGTWSTRASFTNVVVRKGTNILYASDFRAGASEWRVYRGTWSTSSGLYRQTSTLTDCRSTTGDTNWSDYVLTLRARKDSGNEGFLIIFNWLDDNNWTWWNIGGWNNTQHAIEQCVNGSKSVISPAVPGSVVQGQWYDIRVEASGYHVRCYLNDQLIHDIMYPQATALVASATYRTNTGQIILKAVNVSDYDLSTLVSIQGVTNLAPTATGWLLTSASPTDENSLDEPNRVVPVPITVTNVAPAFLHTFPANSLTVLKLQLSPQAPVTATIQLTTNRVDTRTLSNAIPVTLNTFITNPVSIRCTLESAAGHGTNMIVAFYPGDMEQTIPLPTWVLEPESLTRLTLTNPIGCQIAGLNRIYLFTPGQATDPLRVHITQFSDETVVWWADAEADLLCATNLPGNWIAVSNATSPVPLGFEHPMQFFRLVKQQ